jgi:hypothetical protein
MVPFFSVEDGNRCWHAPAPFFWFATTCTRDFCVLLLGSRERRMPKWVPCYLAVASGSTVWSPNVRRGREEHGKIDWGRRQEKMDEAASLGSGRRRVWLLPDDSTATEKRGLASTLWCPPASAIWLHRGLGGTQTLFTPQYFLDEIQSAAGTGIVRTRFSGSCAPLLTVTLLERAPSRHTSFASQIPYLPPSLNSSTSTHPPPTTASKLSLPSPSHHSPLSLEINSSRSDCSKPRPVPRRPSARLCFASSSSLERSTVDRSLHNQPLRFLTSHTSQDGYDLERTGRCSRKPYSVASIDLLLLP